MAKAKTTINKEAHHEEHEETRRKPKWQRAICGIRDGHRWKKRELEEFRAAQFPVKSSMNFPRQDLYFRQISTNDQKSSPAFLRISSCSSCLRDAHLP
jgi:hypothetical protein